MKLAAVVYEPGEAKAVDALFVKLAACLKADGRRVAGAVQYNDMGNACANMVLEDIATGRTFDISVPGEKKRDSCSLDPTALEDVAGQVAATLETAPDLVIVNRFGKQEVLGNGLRSVIESAIGAGLPVLTALCVTHVESWNGFTGESDERLTASLPGLLEWCTSVLAERV
jgi:hypothetical protein